MGREFTIPKTYAQRYRLRSREVLEREEVEEMRLDNIFRRFLARVDRETVSHLRNLSPARAWEGLDPQTLFLPSDRQATAHNPHISSSLPRKLQNSKSSQESDVANHPFQDSHFHSRIPDIEPHRPDNFAKRTRNAHTGYHLCSTTPLPSSSSHRTSIRPSILYALRQHRTLRPWATATPALHRQHRRRLRMQSHWCRMSNRLAHPPALRRQRQILHFHRHMQRHRRFPNAKLRRRYAATPTTRRPASFEHEARLLLNW